METMSVKEVAQYLDCSISSIREMIRKNEIPYFRIRTRIKFNKKKIDEWTEAGGTKKK